MTAHLETDTQGQTSIIMGDCEVFIEIVRMADESPLSAEREEQIRNTILTALQQISEPIQYLKPEAD